jgi:4-amino-4-deoxy-L-arabinose transferase-like glycosyltransferase
VSLLRATVPSIKPSSVLAAESESDAPTSDIDWRASVSAILWLTMLGLGLRLVFLNGPVGSDDLRYFSAAETIAHGGRITSLDHATSRLVFLLVVGVPGVWIGSMFVSGVVNILISVATQIIAATFAYRRISARAGVIVAAVLAFDGIAIAYSGILLPDNLLSLLCLLCAMLVYYGLVATPQRATASLFAAGLAAGLAYSTKDTGILLVVPVVALLALWPSAGPAARRFRLAVVFLTTFCAVWILEGFFYLVRAGDFLYKPHAIAAVHNAAIPPAANLLEFLRHGYWNLTTTIYSVWLTLVPLVVGVVCWIVLIRRRHEMTTFALIGAFICAFLFFGSSSVTRLVNLPYQERYFGPILPFVAISLSAVLDVLARGRGTWRGVAPMTIAAACLVGGVIGAAARSGTLYFTEGLRNAAIAVAVLAPDGRPIFADWRIRDGLVHYLPKGLSDRVMSTRDTVSAKPTGYYLVVMRDGRPIWVDSTVSASILSSKRLTISLSQRRVDAWYPVPRRLARDSVVVYDLGQR